MFQLFLLGALGPHLVRDLGLREWQLGALAASGFAVAAVLSIPIGSVVDRVGHVRALAVLFLLCATALAVAASAGNGWWLLAGVVIGSVPQALANPVTNKLIAAAVPPARRGAAIGWKQSGVQLGAFVAGLPLSLVATVTSWRLGVALLAVATLAAAVAAGRLRLSGAVPAPAKTDGSTTKRIVALAVFSVALGVGLATVNTFLTLYGHQRLDLSDGVAGALVASLGVAGIAGRVCWGRVAGALGDPTRLLPWLALGAAASGALLLLADAARPLVWLGALGIGVFGMSANAVSMIAVVAEVPRAAAGRAAAVVSTGFFAGFAVGPACGGVLVDRLGYGWMWTGVAAAFVVAAAIASRMPACAASETSTA